MWFKGLPPQKKNTPNSENGACQVRLSKAAQALDWRWLVEGNCVFIHLFKLYTVNQNGGFAYKLA